MNEENSPNLANANRAIYYWDYYLTTGEVDCLTCAAQFMLTFRQNGGTGLENQEEAIHAAVRSHAKPS